MERKEKAQKSAESISTMAKFIACALTLDYPADAIKTILDMPLKQLEDELGTLKAYIHALR